MPALGEGPTVGTGDAGPCLVDSWMQEQPAGTGGSPWVFDFLIQSRHLVAEGTLRGPSRRGSREAGRFLPTTLLEQPQRHLAQFKSFP